MQFFVPFFALLATSALAMPNTFETRDVEAGQLEARANCGQILPACNGGNVVGQTNCRCKGQKETCDLWHCPGDAPNVVSLLFLHGELNSTTEVTTKNPALSDFSHDFMKKYLLIEFFSHTDGLRPSRYWMCLDLNYNDDSPLVGQGIEISWIFQKGLQLAVVSSQQLLYLGACG